MHLSVILLEIFLICYTLDKLFNEAEKVYVSAYELDWFNMDKSLAKDVQLLMIRAQQSVGLTAGGFYLIQLETFQMVKID